MNEYHNQAGSTSIIQSQTCLRRSQNLQAVRTNSRLPRFRTFNIFHSQLFRTCSFYYLSQLFSLLAPKVLLDLSFFTPIFTVVNPISLSSFRVMIVFILNISMVLIHENQMAPSAPGLLNHPPTRLQLGLSFSWQKEKKEE